MATHGKKYQASAQMVESAKSYNPEEAIELAKKAAHASFDETV